MFISIIKKFHSVLKNNKKNELKYQGIKICLIYSIIGFLWIYFSDRIAHRLASGNNILLIISTYKGWLYIIVTSIILYLLLIRIFKKVDLTEKKLTESYSELAAVNDELEAYVQQLTASEEELRFQYDQIIDSEDKLRKSEEKNRAIIKAIPDLLFVINNEGYFIDCMASDESLLLRPKEVFIGKNLSEIMPKEISEIAFEKIQLVLKNGMMENFEYKLEISNNKQYFELRMAKNNEKEVLAISRNVTVEKQNELELKISEEKYKNLVDKMQQGLAIYEAIVNEKEEVIDFRFLDGNESHEKITGIKNKDILAQPISKILPSLEKNFIEKFRYVVKTGESICYENYIQEKDRYYEVIAYRPKELQLAVIVNDITERKLAEESIKASEYNFRNIFEGSSDAIFLEKDDKVIYCNQAMIELLGYDSKECIVDKSITGKFSPEKQPDGKPSREKALEMYKRTMKNGKCKFEWWYKTIDGRLLPVEVMMTTILHNGEKVFHSIWRDIGERKQMENKLEYLSYHDQLTGLYNRRFFEEELSRLDEEGKLPLTIVMADVNGLKLVNDSFGHATGDELLKKVVEVITNGCRTEDIVARQGGDEFVMLLPKTDICEAEQIVKRIKALASKEKVGSVDISISFGYETKNNKEEKIQDILKKAEDHMYKKKLFESPSMRGKTINAIITTLHEKNKREEQHSYRVSKLCEGMGIALGLSEYEIKELKNVGLLHDIGKIAIEENILNKNGKLTDEEWEEIKRHPEIGYRILSTVNDMSEMAEYVLAHHEMWNGMGYPKGLKGEEIPLKSRIITIVDSYDAMISERSYRSALSEEVAIEELKINAGIQFDPKLIKVFLEEVLNKPFD